MIRASSVRSAMVPRAEPVVIIGPFYPPVSGAAKNTKIIADAVAQRGAKVARLSTSTRKGLSHNRSAGYHAVRAFRFASNIFRLPALRAGGMRRAYIVPDGGAGIFYTLAYCVVARMLGMRLFLHHRNYSHITKQHRVMAAIVRVVQPAATHIFLDARMADDFEATYGAHLDKLIVPNAATTDIPPRPPTSAVIGDDAGTVTVGFLSNLTVEKGFDAAAEAFRLLTADSDRYRFLLAGAPVNAAEARRLDALRETLGERLDYRGPVYGQEKARFFQTCDVFLFPTRFRQEAQPNVIFEALAAGALVVATPRGCIPAMLEGFPSALVEEDDRLAEGLAAAAAALVARPGWRAKRASIVAMFTQSQAEAGAQYERLLDLLAGGARDEPLAETRREGT